MTDLERLAVDARLAASAAGLYDGRGGPPSRRCTHVHRRTGAIVLFTRDGGMHTSGWFKNPDFERCWHLSISFRDPATGDPRPFDRRIAEQIVEAFYGDDKRYALVESAKTAAGRILEVWHYRVFANPAWEPLHPRGEVYSREWTEKGWQTWSEVHGSGGRPFHLELENPDH